MRTKRKYIGDARNLSPLLKEETKQVLNFVFKGIPIKDFNALQYYFIPSGRREPHKYHYNWEEGNVLVYFYTHQGLRSFIVNNGSHTIINFPSLGLSYKDENGIWFDDSWQKGVVLYNKFAILLYSVIKDTIDLTASSFAVDNLRACLDNFWGEGYSYFDSSSTITLSLNNLVLEKLRRLLVNYINSDCLHSFTHYEQPRRFGYKNGMIFHYKGASKVEMRLGKGLRKLFKLTDSYSDDNQIKQIVSEIKAENAPYELRVVEPDQIPKYYHDINHAPTNIGTLAQSCMRYDFCNKEHYFDFYKDNCKGMLILVNPTSDKIRGRALLWETVDGYKIMDRVYASDENYHLFFDWALKNGYWRKEKQTHSSHKYWVDPDNEYRTRRFAIKLDADKFHYDKYPYADSFSNITRLIKITRDMEGRRIYSEDKVEWYASNLYLKWDSPIRKETEHLRDGSEVFVKNYNIRSTRGDMTTLTI